MTQTSTLIPVEALEPKEVFKHFAEISKIPRGSKKEKAISDYLAKFADEKGLKFYQDSSYNLRIKKPGTPGHEDDPAVILQAHMDMVWNKEDGYDFDFETHPIKCVVEGDILKSYRTTLGADDGIGVAFIMALMEAQDIVHPPLEFLLTTQEELGMGGAKEFDVSELSGKTFINIDSEDEGVFCSSCCGGMRIYIRLPAERQPIEKIPHHSDYIPLKIEIKNLRGGHSGTEIDKERGNSNRLMGRLLLALQEKYSYYLASIYGGIAPNAISSHTEATILVDSHKEIKVRDTLSAWQEIFRNELKNSDGKKDSSGQAFEVEVNVQETPLPDDVFTSKVLEQVITATTLFPHGVAAMDLSLEDQRIPETSDNFAMIDTKRDAQGSCILFTANIRSSLATKKTFLKNQFTTIAEILGATYTIDGEYPAWEFDPDSHIRKVFVQAFEKVYGGRQPKIEGIHAGLECGIFADHFKNHKMDVDLIAFGPDIFGAHTPQERVVIASVERNWKLLKKVLEIMSEYKEDTI